jgi:hypothetical protein
LVFYAIAATGRGSVPLVYCHRSTLCRRRHRIYSSVLLDILSWGKSRYNLGRPAWMLQKVFFSYDIEDPRLIGQEIMLLQMGRHKTGWLA